MDEINQPVVCTLGPRDAQTQLRGWQDLRQHVRRVERTADGVRIEVPSALRADLERLVVIERACCAFLAIDITELSPEALAVDVRSANPAAMPVIEAIAGLHP